MAELRYGSHCATLRFAHMSVEQGSSNNDLYLASDLFLGVYLEPGSRIALHQKDQQLNLLETHIHPGTPWRPPKMPGIHQLHQHRLQIAKYICGKHDISTHGRSNHGFQQRSKDPLEYPIGTPGCGSVFRSLNFHTRCSASGRSSRLCSLRDLQRWRGEQNPIRSMRCAGTGVHFSEQSRGPHAPKHSMSEDRRHWHHKMFRKDGVSYKPPTSIL